MGYFKQADGALRRNRTSNLPSGGASYIHLTMSASNKEAIL